MKKKTITRKRINVAIITFAMIFLISIVQAVIAQMDATNECWIELRSGASNSAQKLDNLFGGLFSATYDVADSLKKNKNLRGKSVRELIMSRKLGIAQAPARLYLPEGYTVTDEGAIDDASELIDYYEIISEEPYLSTTHADNLSVEKKGDFIMEYFVPIKNYRGEIEGMVSSVIRLDNLTEFMQTDIYDGEAEIRCLDLRDGTVIVNTKSGKVSRIAEGDLTTENVDKGLGIEKYEKELFSGIETSVIRKRSAVEKDFYHAYAVPTSSVEGMHIGCFQVILEVPEKVAFVSATKAKRTVGITILAETIVFSLFVWWLSKDYRKEIAQKERFAKEHSAEQIIDMVVALAEEYDHMLLIHPKTGEYDMYMVKSDDMAKYTSMTPHGENVYDIFENDKSKVIFGEDTEKFAKFYCRESMMAVAETGEPREVELRVISGSGYRWKLARAVRMIDSFNNTSVVVGIKDTDVRHEELARKARAEALLDGLAREYHTVLILDVSKMEVSVFRSTGNKTIKSMLHAIIDNRDYNNLIKQYINTKIVEEDRERVAMATRIDTVIKETPEVGTYIVSYRRYNDEGRIDYHQMCFAKAVSGDGVKNYVVAFRDVDAAMKEEKERQEALSNALKMADAANRAKTAFLSNMSHDIRTPMNAIIGFTTLAEKHIGEKEQVMDYLDKISQSSELLLSLINDVLDMSRIEAGKFSLNQNRENLHLLLRSLEDITSENAKAKNIEFTLDISDIKHDEVFCDKLRLKQVLLNLLSNAIKYTENGGKVSFLAKEKSSYNSEFMTYEFVISDNGIGMSEEFVKTIFEPFSREHTATMSGIPGTGLGMAIVKSIVDMMEGTIAVESEKGIGSKFTVIIDLKQAANETEKLIAIKTDSNTAVHRSYAGRNVLLVEDNELNLEIATDILVDQGFSVETASDGTYAVEKVEKSAEYTYDLILMDVQMPEMDGYEATRRIRAMKREDVAKIPIISMTANAFEEDRKQAIASGMNEHIAKPINIEKLMSIIDKFLE